MNPSDLARAFGFPLSSEHALVSIYPYSSVYRLSNDRGAWYINSAQKPYARAQAVAAWTRDLADQGLSLVTPAQGFGENPRAFHPGKDLNAAEEVWVVYPFIAGQPYTGDDVQIRAAGALLGAIHAT